MVSPKQLFWYVFFERFSKEKNAMHLDSPLTFEEYLELRKSCWFIEKKRRRILL
jgi:hypothetical protein